MECSGVGGDRKRILIADDVPAVRRLLTRIVERDGRFDVVGHAEDGAQAVTLTGELQPDLLILDLMMPEKSGEQALGEIRSVSPDTKVVVFSALPAKSMPTVEVEGYIEKGESPAGIMAELERLIS